MQLYSGGRCYTVQAKPPHNIAHAGKRIAAIILIMLLITLYKTCPCHAGLNMTVVTAQGQLFLTNISTDSGSVVPLCSDTALVHRPSNLL